MRGSYVSESGTEFSYFPESLQISRHVSLQFLFFSLTLRAKTLVRVSQWFKFQDGRGWGRLLWSLHTTQVSEARTIFKMPIVHVLICTSVWMWPPRSPGSSPPRPRWWLCWRRSRSPDSRSSRHRARPRCLPVRNRQVVVVSVQDQFYNTGVVIAFST